MRIHNHYCWMEATSLNRGLIIPAGWAEMTVVLHSIFKTRVRIVVAALSAVPFIPASGRVEGI
ncbi:hypothetical protein Metal_1873 [Methylomicrobium album BG8]|uniref:Uncharacterized protein n=1 Tax=Methylomicrobium album BG8 TaxID=686340 RepID=H8GP53_METAL|nr:hypothetical protein Metal_1873 [Methylomicrobium album BG8]